MQYLLEPTTLTFLNTDVRNAQELCLITDDQLGGYIRSQTACQYLFPKDRIVVNSVPYRVIEANIPAIREGKDITAIYSDVNFDYLNTPKGVLSIGSLMPVPNPAYAYDIELYGSDYDSIRSHIVRHLLRLKSKTSDLTSIFVFVDEDFQFGVIDNIMSDFGMQRIPWCEQIAKRMMYEKILERTSSY